MRAQVVILDFGSQFTQLIARTVRELGVYCEIIPGTSAKERVLENSPKAVILSGGPSSVISETGLRADQGVLTSGTPIFAICYGLQVVAKQLGGVVTGWGLDSVGTDKPVSAGVHDNGIREFGPAKFTLENPIGPFKALGKGQFDVWMSHGDKVTSLPPGFIAVGTSPGSPFAACGCDEKKIYGVQFHPEVHHTPRGKDLLKSFLFDIAGVKQDWDPESFIDETVNRVRAAAKSGNVVCALSGGVDSTVAAVPVHKAIGDRLHCIFVDNGLLRYNEAQETITELSELGLNVKLVDASKRFLDELHGITDPEKKRKIIGRVFIDVFEDEAHRITDVEYLVQGTLYPDVIESVSVVGKSDVIKSHHNVGGLKENMKLQLIEPLRELFKDEVRQVGRKLGIHNKFIAKQPFPGPGLAVRCLGDLTPERLHKLRLADKVVREEVERAGYTEKIWQSFAVLLPVRSVGVMGDSRTYDEAIAIRAVTSRDGMTADWVYFPEPILRTISARIVNEVSGVNRVVLDISSKPPSTIEWE